MHKKNIKSTITILSPSIVLVALAMDITIPLIPAIVEGFQTPLSTAQWVLSIFFLGTGIGQLVIGPFTDHYGRRTVILTCIVGYILTSLICAISPSIISLILARFFQGFTACGASVVVMAIIRDLFEDHANSAAYSYVNGVTALAPILAPLLGGYLLIWTNTWRSSFVFVSLFGIFALLVNLKLLSETKNIIKVNKTPKTKHIISNYFKILKSRDFRVFTYCATTGLTGLLLFFSISPILLIKILNIAPNIYGYYFAINFIIYLSGNLISPMLQERFNIIPTTALGSLSMLVGCSIMMFWHLFFGLSVSGLIVPSLIMSFGVGLLYGPCMSRALKPFKDLAGTAAACFGACLYCSSAIIAAIIMHSSINSTFYLAATIIIMSSINLLLLFRYHRRALI